MAAAGEDFLGDLQIEQWRGKVDKVILLVGVDRQSVDHPYVGAAQCRPDPIELVLKATVDQNNPIGLLGMGHDQRLKTQLIGLLSLTSDVLQKADDEAQQAPIGQGGKPQLVGDIELMLSVDPTFAGAEEHADVGRRFVGGNVVRGEGFAELGGD